jgi:YjbE family integral membrane protein
VANLGSCDDLGVLHPVPGRDAATAFWVALGKIMWINILLSGDNALVIAMACRGLPPRQRFWGMVLGAGVAVFLRIIFTGIVVTLMNLPYLKLVGGLALLVIAAKLLVPENEDEGDVHAASHLWAAVQIVAIADIVMSLDNVIAVAAAANGSIPLLVIGLAISVPLIVRRRRADHGVADAPSGAGVGRRGPARLDRRRGDGDGPCDTAGVARILQRSGRDRPRWTPQIARHGAAVRQWRARRRGDPWNPWHHHCARRRVDLAQAQDAGRRALGDGVGSSAQPPQRRQSPAALMAPGICIIGKARPAPGARRDHARPYRGRAPAQEHLVRS